ncbi:MAG: hypothetical protein H7Y89_20270 [Steroidobacteraceae bacterium]|nr:hypothetical protein [Steroidobacteraceae bacterium]
MKASALKPGSTYFRLTYSDPDLTMPGVEPVVYLSEVTDDDGTHGYVFQDTASYVRLGSGLEGEEQSEEIGLYFVPDDDLGTISDLAEVVADVTAAGQRAAELGYPQLRVIRDGWKNPD